MRVSTLIAAAAVLALAGLLALPLTAARKERHPEERARAAALVQQFAGELQAALAGALEQGGPAAAIPVCSQRAPDIAATLSRTSGAYVRRVSLRLRNPQDMPDVWEQEALLTFDRRAAGGTDPATLVQTAVTNEPDGRYYRFLKAIPTQGLCLACHGAQIDPVVQRILDERYPHDQARGYREGMVRGAFSVKMKLEPR